MMPQDESKPEENMNSSIGFAMNLLANGPAEEEEEVKQPSEEKKDAILQFYNSFSKLYPCTYCADELKEDLKIHKIRNENRISLSIQYLPVILEVTRRAQKQEKLGLVQLNLNGPALYSIKFAWFTLILSKLSQVSVFYDLRRK